MTKTNNTPLADKTQRFIDGDGRKIVAKRTRHHDGEWGWYGCPDYAYERNGNRFASACRYYFGQDRDALRIDGPITA